MCDIFDGTSADCNENVIPDECEEGSPFPANFVSSVPSHESSLWRTQNNVTRLTFACNVSAPNPGELVIELLDDDGVVGPDLSASFTFTLEDTAGGYPRILKIHGEPMGTLTHRKWYAIRNTGWGGVAHFEVQYVVQVGDANEDGRVQFNDLAFINTGVVTAPAPDDDRKDINGDGLVQFNDLAAANTSIPSGLVAKPSGGVPWPRLGERRHFEPVSAWPCLPAKVLRFPPSPHAHASVGMAPNTAKV